MAFCRAGEEKVIYALAGFLAMIGILSVIGINQPRRASIKTWCYGYLLIAVTFDVLVVLALLNRNIPTYESLTELFLGLSAGAATGLAIHVAHHIREEDQERPKEGKGTNLGF